MPSPAVHAGRGINTKNTGQPHSEVSSDDNKPNSASPGPQLPPCNGGKADVWKTRVDEEGQLITDRVSEQRKTLLKAMNSIPNPGMNSQVENRRPREGQVLYQATQQITVRLLGLRAAPNAACGFAHSVFTT